MARITAAAFLERFVLPLVAGGEVHVGRPLTTADLARLTAELDGATVPLVAVEDARTDAPARSLAKAVAVNLLNPHPYLFWFSVGAPLLLKGWREGPAAAALFLTGFYVCLVGSKLLIAALVGRGRRLLTGRVYVWIMRSLGVALFAFSALFVREGYRLLVH